MEMGENGGKQRKVGGEWGENAERCCKKGRCSRSPAFGHGVGRCLGSLLSAQPSVGVSSPAKNSLSPAFDKQHMHNSQDIWCFTPKYHCSATARPVDPPLCPSSTENHRFPPFFGWFIRIFAFSHSVFQKITHLHPFPLISPYFPIFRNSIPARFRQRKFLGLALKHL